MVRVIYSYQNSTRVFTLPYLGTFSTQDGTTIILYTCVADHVVQRPDVEAHLFLRMIDIGKPVGIDWLLILWCRSVVLCGVISHDTLNQICMKRAAASLQRLQVHALSRVHAIVARILTTIAIRAFLSNAKCLFFHRNWIRSHLSKYVTPTRPWTLHSSKTSM